MSDDKQKIVTTHDIIKTLHGYYRDNSQYVIANSYVFNHDWESDVFVLNKAGYSYEFEVKVSRADFKNDLKKVRKHEMLSAGKSEKFSGIMRPNRFYYTVPTGLIKPDEVPEYAGLYYMTKYSFEEIKKAPLLHKEKFNFNDILCPKFYHHNYGLKYDNLRLVEENKFLRERYQYFDPDQFDKMKPPRVRSFLKKMRYVDYLKWMIEFKHRHTLIEILIEIGAVMERTGDQVYSHRHDYAEYSDRYRPLTEVEFRKFQK